MGIRITSREQAIEAGESTFYTGKPCKHGHLTERYTINGTCAECARVKSRATQQRARASIKARLEAARAANTSAEA